MPMKPNAGESQSDFMHRCVPEMMAGDREQDQAVAICMDIWRNKDKTVNAIRKVHSGSTNGMEFVLSDETIDRMGDVIRASGWDLTNFKKNPIALFNHKSDFPVGKWTNLRIDGNSLRGHLELAAKGISARIDELIGLVEAGILRAVSVGFHHIESKPLGKGIEFVKQELVETSLVSVPANPNALAVAKSLGVSEEIRNLVFSEPDKRRKTNEAYIGYLDLQTLDEWSPYEARKAKQWLNCMRKTYPMNMLYRKMYRLFDEIEAVRTVSVVLAETGKKD